MVLRIRELREAAGMQQKQLAALMGVLPSVISNWEAETALPRTRQLPQLAYFLRCTIDDLFAPESIVVDQDTECHAS